MTLHRVDPFLGNNLLCSLFIKKGYLEEACRNWDESWKEVSGGGKRKGKEKGKGKGKQETDEKGKGKGKGQSTGDSGEKKAKAKENTQT